jgi:Tol biopolymer transport system component
MNMQERTRLRKSLWSVFFLLCGAVAYAPCEQREVLLFGNTYDAVLLKIDGRTVEVPPPPGFIGQGLASLPSLSPDGNLIAWGLTLPYSVASGSEKEGHPRPFSGKSVLGVYSANEKSWSFYGGFCSNGIGSTAFAADGKRIAFFATKAPSGPNCVASPDLNAFQLHTLNLGSGLITTVPGTERLMENAAISWSPDGKFLVAQSGFWGSLDRIVVIELATGNRKILADGIDPLWSPSGEWIAYLTDRRDKCVLTHLDGTGTHVVASSRHGFNQGAVWSPDSERLLLNEGFFYEKNDVLELSLSSNKILRKMPHSMFAFGWHMTSPSSSEGPHRQP